MDTVYTVERESFERDEAATITTNQSAIQNILTLHQGKPCVLMLLLLLFIYACVIYVIFFILQISWRTAIWLVTTIPCGFCMPMEWTLTTRPSHTFWLAHPPLRWHEETWPYPMTVGKTWWNGAFVKSRQGRRSQCSDASYEYVIKSNYRGQSPLLGLL